jgi:hypothetical protein
LESHSKAALPGVNPFAIVIASCAVAQNEGTILAPAYLSFEKSLADRALRKS